MGISAEFDLDARVPVDVSPGSIGNWKVAYNGAGLYFVAWVDSRESGSSIIYGTRVLPDGTPLDPLGLKLAALTPSSESYAASSLGWCLAGRDGTFKLAWGTTYRSRPHYEAPEYSTSETITITAEGKLSRTTNCNNFPTIPEIPYDYTSCFYVYQQSCAGAEATSDLTVWMDGPSLRARATSTTGDGQLICKSPNREVQPALAFDGTNYLAVWADNRRNANDIFGLRVSPTGQILDPVAKALAPLPALRTNPSVVFDGQVFVVAWQETNTTGGLNIMGARLSSQGELLNTAPILISSAGGDQSAPLLISDAAGTTLAIWLDTRDGTSQIYGARLDEHGTVLDPDGFRISKSGVTDGPSVAYSSGSFVVTWIQKTPSPSRVLGARVGTDGTLKNMDDVLFATFAGAKTSRIASDSHGFLLIWLDSTWDRYSCRPRVHGLYLNQDLTPTSTSPLNFSFDSLYVLSDLVCEIYNPSLVYANGAYLGLVSTGYIYDALPATIEVRRGGPLYTFQISPRPQESSVFSFTKLNTTSDDRTMVVGGSGQVFLANSRAYPDPYGLRVRGKFLNTSEVGSACTAAEQCGSGVCQTVCCDRACPGPCLACQAAKTGLLDGQCGPLLPASLPSNPCAHGQCGSEGCACEAGWRGATCEVNICGDGILVGEEQCEKVDGVLPECCHAVTCKYIASDTPCGAQPTLCHARNTCDGAGTCVDRGLLTDPSICTHGHCEDSGCACDTGWEGYYCADSICGDGLLVGAEQCEKVDGVLPECCSPTTCKYYTSSKKCGPPPGPCESANICNGAGACIKDGFIADGTPCVTDSSRCSINSCQKGFCVAGAPKDCSDASGCTIDTCNALTGACEHTSAETGCDDQNPCTHDACDALTTCQYTPLLDWSACGSGKGCFAGTCAAYPADNVCEGATALGLGEPQERAVALYRTYNTVPASCTGLGLAGPTVFFSFAYEADKSYLVHVTPKATADVAVVVWKDCVLSATCMIGANSGALGAEERLTLPPQEQPGTLIVEVAALASPNSGTEDGFSILVEDVATADGDGDSDSSTLEDGDSDNADSESVVDGDSDVTTEDGDSDTTPDGDSENFADGDTVDSDSTLDGDSDDKPGDVDVETQDGDSDSDATENDTNITPPDSGSGGGCQSTASNTGLLTMLGFFGLLLVRRRKFV